jgi:prevent-host-death family protein
MYIGMYTLRMSKSYSVAQARAHLSDIFDEVDAGEEVQLTRRGQPVAVVISVGKLEALRGHRASFRNAYRSFLNRHPMSEVGLQRRFFVGLRDRRGGRRVQL